MTNQPAPDDTPSAAPEIDQEQDDRIIGVVSMWSLVVLGVVAAIGLGIYFTSGDGTRVADPEPEPPPPAPRDLSDAEIPRAQFRDITAAAGITFVQENGATGEKLLPETMGGGCAFLDFNNDQFPDILLVNSQRWESDRDGQAATSNLTLYQNDGSGQFADVTGQVGLDVSVYGMGVAAGDYDNDGYVDLFVSTLFENRLFHNEQGERFTDVTATAGVGGAADHWSSSCGWVDYDNDGDLDLVVCNYLKWSRDYDLAQDFKLTGGGRAYGRPNNFEGQLPYLYRNQGDGTFVEVAAEAGLHLRDPDTNSPLFKSLGLTFADFDGDHHMDIMMANDTVANVLLHNQGDGSFTELASLAGVAFDQNTGEARAGMGIDNACFRNSTEQGVAIGNFANEMTALYVADAGRLQFVDEAMSSGMGPNTRLALTFGVLFLDYDLDGKLDLFSANGHLEKDVNIGQPSQHYAQPPQLFWNCGVTAETEFAPASPEHLGDEFFVPIVGRGSACADIDRDGDIDLLIGTVGGSPRLLRNDQELGHHWIAFKLRGSTSNRDAIGAVVEIRQGEETLRRQVMPTRSYQSQSELPITIGLGDLQSLESVTIRWPDGTSQQVDNPALDQLHEIRQASDSASGA